MPRTQGRKSTLDISVDNENNYFSLGCLGDIGFGLTQEEIEVTCRDDGPYRAFLSGRIDGELTFEGQWVEEDSGQGFIIGAAFDATPVTIRYRPYGEGAGLREFISKAIITSLNVDSELDGSVTFDGTLRLTGQISPSFQ